MPGLGEWYAGSKKRGLAFLGAEATLWGMWVAWKGKGKDLEEEFRAVADDHWGSAQLLGLARLDDLEQFVNHARAAL